MKITESELQKIIEEETVNLIEQDPRFAKLKNLAQQAAPKVAQAAQAAGRGVKAVGRGLNTAAKTTGQVAGAVGQVAGAVGKTAGAVGDVAKLGTQALKTLRPSKQADVNKVVKGLNRIKAPALLNKIDKPLEVQELLMSILGNVQVDPKVLDTVLNKIKAQLKASAKQQAAPAQAAPAQAAPAAAPGQSRFQLVEE